MSKKKISDKERLSFCQRNKLDIMSTSTGGDYWYVTDSFNDAESKGVTLRKAIDAAMRKKYE